MVEPVVRVRGLVKRFGEVTAVDGIDLDLAPGICVGLLGPNGAGKTTTIEILEGLQEPTSGEVHVLGKTWAHDAKHLRSQIGIQLQETQFYNELTVEESLIMFESFFPKRLGIDRVIQLVQLEEKRRAYVAHLSGGQRQRLGLAVALICDPVLLFLDEPTTGLDPQVRRALWDVVETIKREGKTVLLTTHSMEEAERLCDRVIIIDRGKIVADGTKTSLIASLGAEELIEFAARPAIAAETLAGLPGVSRVHEQDGVMRLAVKELHVSVPALIAAAHQQGSELLQLSTRQATLDDVFLTITGRTLREAP